MYTNLKLHLTNLIKIMSNQRLKYTMPGKIAPYKMMLKSHYTIWGYNLWHPLYKFDIQIWHFFIQSEASIIQIWHIMTINYVYKFEITLYKFDQIYVKSKAKYTMPAKMASYKMMLKYHHKIWGHRGMVTAG